MCIYITFLTHLFGVYKSYVYGLVNFHKNENEVYIHVVNTQINKQNITKTFLGLENLEELLVPPSGFNYSLFLPPWPRVTLFGLLAPQISLISLLLPQDIYWLAHSYNTHRIPSEPLTHTTLPLTSANRSSYLFTPSLFASVYEIILKSIKCFLPPAPP